MKHVLVWAAGDALPFLSMVADTVEETAAGLVLVNWGIEVCVSDYHFYSWTNAEDEHPHATVSNK